MDLLRSAAGATTVRLASEGEFAARGPVRLGTAFIDTTRCLPWANDIPCVVCEEVCPVSPKAIGTYDEEITRWDGTKVTLNKPYMRPELCIGCGICERECPVVDDAAVYVTAVGDVDADICVLTWGSTYAAVHAAWQRQRRHGKPLAWIHLEHLNPLPNDLGDKLRRFDQVLVPELNKGQLCQLVRGKARNCRNTLKSFKVAQRRHGRTGAAEGVGTCAQVH